MKYIKPFVEYNYINENNAISNEYLNWLLTYPSPDRIPNEKGKVVDNGITIYRDNFGSYRFIKYINGVAVSGIQVMSRDGKKGYVTNAYTHQDFRRQGHAEDIINYIKNYFSELTYSNDLSSNGRDFLSKINPPIS